MTQSREEIVRQRSVSLRGQSKKLLAGTLVTLVALSTILSPIGSIAALAASSQFQEVIFTESELQNQSKTITIPNLVRVNSISVDTGNVTYTQNGDDITINVSGGVPSRTVWNDQKYSKDVSKSETNNRNTFADTSSYTNPEGYAGNLSKSGSSVVVSGVFTPEDTKTVSQKRTQSNDSGWPSSINYNNGGYTGTLYPEASSTSRVASGSAPQTVTKTDFRTSSSNSFPATVNYNDGTYSGTLSKNGASYVASGSYTPAETTSRSGSNSSASCPPLSGYSLQSCSWSGVYRVGSGDYFTKIAAKVYGDAYPEWESIQAANPGVNSSGLTIGQLLNIPSSAAGTPLIVSTINAGFKYSGTYYKPASDTRVYRQNYSGSATSQDTRVYEYDKNYTGDVTKPESDTRIWQQNYEGTVYKGGDDLYFTYKVVIDYTAIPDTPTGLKATPDDRKVTLDWDAHPDASVIGYHVYQDGVKLTTEPLSSTSFDVLNLVNGETYKFTITAVDSQNESLHTSVVSAIPKDSIAPASPTGLKASPTDNQVPLVWSAVSDYDVKGYNVYMDGQKVNTSLITDTSYNAVNLINGQSYEFEVSAVDTSDNESVKSKITSSPKDTIAPEAPLALSGTPAMNSVVLNWSPSGDSDVLGYYVYRNGDRITNQPISGTTYTAIGLTNGYSYKFTVSAVDHFNNVSVHSNAVNVTPTNQAIMPEVNSTGTIPADTTIRYYNFSDNEADSIKLNGKGTVSTLIVKYQDGTELIINPENTALPLTISDIPVKPIDYIGVGYDSTTTAPTISSAQIYKDGTLIEQQAGSTAITPSLDTLAPGEVTDLQGTSNGNSAKITWKKPSDQDFAKTLVFQDGKLIATLVEESLTVSDLQLNTNYEFSFKTEDSAGNRSEGQSLTVTTGTSATADLKLPADFAIEATPLEEGMDLKWKAVSGAESYTIIRDGIIIANTTRPAFVDYDVVPNIEYKYEVIVNGKNGAVSEPVETKAQTPTNFPSNFIVKKSSNGGVLLQWDEVEGAEFYVVKLSGRQIYKGSDAMFEMGPSLLKANVLHRLTVVSGTSKSKATSRAAGLQFKTNGNKSLVEAASVPKKLEKPSFRPQGNRIYISWKATPDAHSYTISRNGVIVGQVYATAYMDIGLDRDTVQNYEIWATNDAGNSEKLTFSASTLPFAPNAANDLTATPAKDSVSLTWSELPEAQYYMVYQGSTRIYKGTDTKYTKTSLLPGKEYSFTIYGYNAAGIGKPSEVKVQTLPSAPFQTTKFSASKVTKTSAQLTWTSIYGANSYKIYKGSEVVFEGTGNTLSVDGLVPGETTTFTLVGINSLGEGSPSELDVTTIPNPPVSPSPDSEPTNNSITLSWDEVPYATSYEVTDSAGKRIWSGAATEYIVTKLLPSKEYSYYVVAINRSGKSEPVMVTTTTEDPYLTELSVETDKDVYSAKGVAQTTVRVTDELGNPVVSQKINFVLTNPDGSQVKIGVITNAEGIAFYKFTLRTLVGEYQIDASLDASLKYQASSGDKSFILE
ncbi:fibronectin type III domain-containing protein [Niallia taxi]|uniref:fibronectin type III domain-containing protein n=1 Tax=Niallia taxi TaxID=2499688 RepID=UPI0015F623E7|nr:LysM peptidoglycan-binding domain-containing protein [Niallia taxi]